MIFAEPPPTPRDSLNIQLFLFLVLKLHPKNKLEYVLDVQERFEMLFIV